MLYLNSCVQQLQVLSWLIDCADLYVKTGQSLGTGSFGCVHAYRNCRTDKEYAVKVSPLILLINLQHLLRVVHFRVVHVYVYPPVLTEHSLYIN